MKLKKATFSSFLISLTAAIIYIVSGVQTNALVDCSTSIIKDNGAYTGIKGSWDYFNEIRCNPSTGQVALKDVLKARDQASRQSSAKSELDIVWQEQGPNNVGGRIRALVIDKNNPSLLYTGGVSGGVFVSDNRGQSWQLVKASVDAGCTAVSTMVQMDDNSLLVGTGCSYEFPTGVGSTGFVGSGLFRMTKNGNDYSISVIESTIPSSHNAAWAAINRLAFSGNVIYAGTSGGLQVSVDAGESWERAEGTGVSICHDVQASEGQVYAFIGSKLYKAEDGFNFEEISGVAAGQFPPTGKRKVLAVHPNNSDVVYAATLKGSGLGCLDAVYRSVDGGNSFETIGVGGANFDPTSNFTYCQGEYDFAIATDPENEKRVLLAGISLWSWEEGKSWQALNNLFDDASNPHYIHSDIHYLEFDRSNSNRLYVCTDGGIFITNESKRENPPFEAINKGLNITQFYGIGAGHSGELLAGSQDNGSQFLTRTVNSTATARQVRDGDGGYAEVSNIYPHILFAATQSGDLRRSSNSGDSFSLFFDCVTDHEGGTPPSPPIPWCLPDRALDNAAFITPYLLWEDPVGYYASQDKEDLTGRAKFFTGNTTGDFFMTPEPLNLVKTRWVELGKVNGAVSAFAVNSTGTLAVVGSSSGWLLKAPRLNEQVVELTDQSALEEYGVEGPNDPYEPGALYYEQDGVLSFTSPLFSGRYITGLSFHPADETRMVVSCGQYGETQHVFYTENVTSLEPDFVSIQSNLPEMPVYDVAFSSYDPDILVAATELGMWTYDFGTNQWTEQNEGLGRIPVLMVREEFINLEVETNEFANDCRVFYIGTHGRGIFKTKSLNTARGFPCSESAIEPDAFNITSVAGNKLNGNELSLYPNPAKELVNINFTLSIQQSVQIVLRDIEGQIVMEKRENDLRPGPHSVELELPDTVMPGNYFISLSGANKRITSSIVISK